MGTFDWRKRSEEMARIRSSGTLIEIRHDEMPCAILGGRSRTDQNVRAMSGSHDAAVPPLRLEALEHRLAKWKRDVRIERVWGRAHARAQEHASLRAKITRVSL